MDESETRLIERTLNWIAAQGYTVIFNVNGTFEELLKTMCREANRLGQESARTDGMVVTSRMSKAASDVILEWPQLVSDDKPELWDPFARQMFLSMYAKRG